MSRMLPFALFLAMCSACSGGAGGPATMDASSSEPSDAASDAGPRFDSGPELDPKIIHFVASSTTVGRGSAVKLAWTVEDAFVVSISTPKETLISSFKPEDTVESAPLFRNEAFTLIAQSGSRTASRTIAVDVIWPEPSFDMFNINQTQVNVPTNVVVFWGVHDIEEVQLLEDGRLIERMPRGTTVCMPDMVPCLNGQITLPVDTPGDHRIALVASNPSHTAERDLTLQALPGPKVTYYSVRPQAFVQTASITVAWKTEGASSTQLVANVAIDNFPFTASGTVTFPLSLFTSLELIANGIIPGMPRSVQMKAGPVDLEMEPNDTMFIATPIATGATASIDPPGDVDFFRYRSLSNGKLHVYLPAISGGCAFHPDLEITLGSTVIATSDPAETLPPGICGEVTAAAVDTSNSVAIRVAARAGERGPYLLFTEEIYVPPSGP